MTALLADRAGFGTQEIASALAQENSVVCAVSQTFYKGALVMGNASGLTVPGATATGQVCQGVATEALVTGVAGGERLRTRSGIHKFENDTGGTPVVQADVGSDCWILDDQTVTGDNTGASLAGKVYSIEPDGQIAVAISFPWSNA